jgi:prepilin-type N-terminal cleavage/methylation domain-containing protein
MRTTRKSKSDGKLPVAVDWHNCAWSPRIVKQFRPAAFQDGNGTIYLLAAGCRLDWHAGKRAATSWRRPSWLPVNAASSRVFLNLAKAANETLPFRSVLNRLSVAAPISHASRRQPIDLKSMKTIPMKSVEYRMLSDKVEGVMHSRHASRFTRHSSPSSTRRAFTIVELLVVIAIIAILAALLLPVLGKAKESGKKAQAKTEISQIVGGIQQYDSVYGRFPVSNAAQNQAAQNAAPANGLNPDFTYGGVYSNAAGIIWPTTSYPLNYCPSNSDVIAILMDLTNYPAGGMTVNTNHQKNPQQTVFLNGKMSGWDPSQGNPPLPGVDNNLVYRDPWGNPYIISMDLNYDEQCRDAFYCSNSISNPNYPASTSNPGSYGLVSPDTTKSDNYQFHGKVMVWSMGPLQSGQAAFDPTKPATDAANKNHILSWQ